MLAIILRIKKIYALEGIVKTNDGNNKNKKKKAYKKPKLTSFGKISDITQTTSVSGPSDGGTVPFDIMMCLTGAPAIEEYKCLTSDVATQEVFERAINRAVKPGDIVLDLGTGTGIHTLFALKAGAKHVYALDAHPVIENARAIIEKNGYSDRVTFIKGRFDSIELPERVDVMISNLGFFGELKNAPECAAKFLKPGGRMIPDAVQLSFCPIEEPNFHSQNIAFWNQKHFGFDFSSVTPMALTTPHYLHLEKENFVTDAFSTEVLSLKSPDVRAGQWKMEFNIPADRTIHGIGGWYSFYFEGEEMFSTRPPNHLHKQLWNNFVFPIHAPMKFSETTKTQCEVRFQFDEWKTDSIWWWKLSTEDNQENQAQH
jgi:protein arginine N-methyltransferase 1